MNVRLLILVVALAGCSGYEEPVGATTLPATTTADDDASAPSAPAPATPAPAAPEPAATEPAATAPAQTRPSSTEPASAHTRPDQGHDLPAATQAYGTILEAVVTPDGLVRYDALNGARLAALDRVVTSFAAVKLPASKNERMAFWCNAYNANVLATATRASRQPGFTGVDAVDGFFDRDRITVAGESMTLNDLENKKIRPLGDARIHAALVCAAVSCPPLRAEPFVADRLDSQLDDQCARWVNDPSKFRLVNGVLGMSKILDWYGKDFDAPPFGNTTGFVLAYAKSGSAISRYILDSSSTRTQWIPYDWALNKAR